MTLKEQIEAKIAEYQGKIDELKSHLSEGGAWLDQDVGSVEKYVAGIVDAIQLDVAATIQPADPQAVPTVKVGP